MKQKPIIVLFLSAVLVLTLSSAQVAFADYDEEYDEEYDDKYERDYDDDRYHDSEEKEHESEHESESECDDDDKYEKERRS